MLFGKKKPRAWYTPAGEYNNLCADILQQPHTLIAGTTGSGKSVLMNAILYAALFQAPVNVRLILIDTKLTEFRQYKALPHTAAYITRAEDVPGVLEHIIELILKRSEEAAQQDQKTSDKADIYIFIDELGDLIFTEPRTVRLLGRIAMIGRSARVHLIAGTQCPNRKTLSAEFAANCPARVGLRCSNRIESTQIISTPDAAALPLYGQAYYKAPQFLTPQLVSVPYYQPEQLSDMVRWWTEQTK